MELAGEGDLLEAFGFCAPEEDVTVHKDPFAALLLQAPGRPLQQGWKPCMPALRDSPALHIRSEAPSIITGVYWIQKGRGACVCGVGCNATNAALANTNTSTSAPPAKKAKVGATKSLVGTIVGSSASASASKSTKPLQQQQPWYMDEPWFPLLTVQPKGNPINPAPPPAYPVWYAHASKEDWVGVPRFFGISQFGLPHEDKRSLGDAMQKGLPFDTSRPLRKEQEMAVSNAVQTLEAWGGAFIEADCGFGKCLGYGTPILMFDGSIKPVQDVVVGDLLMGDDSKPRTVLSLARGREALYRVTPTKGDAYVVNESHILSLKHSTTHGRARKGDVVDISVRDFLALPPTYHGPAGRLLGYRAKASFPRRAVPLDPYMLGYWLGDGSSGAAAITTTDPEIVAYFRVAAARMRLGLYRTGEDITYRITTGTSLGGAGRNPFMNALRELNVLHNKHVPDLYRVNCEEVQLQLLAGIIDSDGHHVKNCYDIVLKSEVLLDGVIFIARSLGFAAYKTVCEKTCTNSAAGPVTGTYYRTCIHGEGTDRIPVKIPRKQAASRMQVKDALVTRIHLEPLGIGDYYGFAIDGNRRFLLGDFTVTHNTSCAIRIALALGRRTLVLCNREVLMDQWRADIQGKGWTWASTGEETAEEEENPQASICPCKFQDDGGCECSSEDDSEDRSVPCNADARVLCSTGDPTASVPKAKRCYRYMCQEGVTTYRKMTPLQKMLWCKDHPCTNSCPYANLAVLETAMEYKSPARRGWVCGEGVVDSLSSPPSVRVGCLQGAWIDATTGRRNKRCFVEDTDFCVGSIDSLAQCDYPKEVLSSFGLVIVDEAHHIAAATLSQVLPKLPSRYILGVSATPDRADGLQHVINWLLGPTCFVYKRTPEVTGKYGAVHVKQLVYTQGSQHEIKYRDGRLGLSTMMSNLAKDQERNRLLFKVVAKSMVDLRKKILIVTATVEHALAMAEHCEKTFKISVPILKGGVKASTVAVARAGDTRLVVATYAYLEEGYDDATIDTLILATPRSRVQQTIGRAERTHPGKLVPLVWDVCEDYSAFRGMAFKRKAFYKSRGFTVERVMDTEMDM